jgi:hypothetical protein
MLGGYMDMLDILGYVLNTAIILIGLFMAVQFYGQALPPTLSGVAFILIGASLTINQQT